MAPLFTPFTALMAKASLSPSSRCSRREYLRAVAGSAAAACVASSARAAPAQEQRVSASPLRVSTDRRRLVREDERPFFWLADTAWELFHRLTSAETELYLKTRAGQGFTALQAILLPEYGHQIANRAKEVPFSRVSASQLVPNSRYFDHVDWVLTRADQLGLYVMAMPSWRYHWKKMPLGGDPSRMSQPFLTEENAASYGRFLGERYGQRPNLLWGLGGDMLPGDDRELSITERLVEGIKSGGSRHLMTYHPGGNKSSSERFHDAPWLDFNMCQSGHRLDNAVWDLVGADWRRTPTKPVLDGECLYEDIPRPLWRHTSQTPHSTAYEVRRPAYSAVLSGAFGYTYGANSVFQFHEAGDSLMYYPTVTWREGLQFTGASQMQHLQQLMLSLPSDERIPDQELLVSPAYERGERITAMRAADGSFAIVYSAAGKPFTLALDRLSGTQLRARWHDPRTGISTQTDSFPRGGRKQFAPPIDGPEKDWVLVVEAAAPAQRREPAD